MTDVVILLNSGPFINFLLHNHSVIYKILIFFFRAMRCVVVVRDAEEWAEGEGGV